MPFIPDSKDQWHYSSL